MSSALLRHMLEPHGIEFEAGSSEEEDVITPQKPPSDGSSERSPPTAETASAATRRHKADMNKKGMKGCKACQKQKSSQEFALNQVVCMPCKSALDVVSKKAKAQGKADWFKNIRQNPKALKALVTNYGNAQAEAEKAGNKKNFWNLATYMEELKASSETIGIKRGKMMWRDQAIEFWQTTAGGSKQKYEAEAKWNHEAANAPALRIATDQKGPSQAPLRLWVHTEDIVDDVRRYTREKSLGLICDGFFHERWGSIFGKFPFEFYL